MKNKFKYIKIILFSICIMFGFKIDVGAITCNYNIDSSTFPYDHFQYPFKDRVAYAFLGTSTLYTSRVTVFSVDDLKVHATVFEGEGSFYLSAKLNVMEGLLWTYNPASPPAMTDQYSFNPKKEDVCPDIIGLNVDTETHYEYVFGEISMEYYTFYPSIQAYNVSDFDSFEAAVEHAKLNNSVIAVHENASNSLEAEECIVQGDVNLLDSLVSKVPNIHIFNEYLDKPENMPSFEKFIRGLDYFSSDCDNAKNNIIADQQKLESLKTGEMATCLDGYYGEGNGMATYANYDASFNGKYIESLDNLYTLLLQYDNLDDICVANDQNELSGYIKQQYCSKVASIEFYGSEEECIKQNLQNEIDAISCDDIYKVAFSDSLTPTEQYLVGLVTKKCTGYSDGTAYKECFKRYCENEKSGISEDAEDIATGTTDEQKNAKETLRLMLVKWVEHDYTEIADLCGVLDDFSDYINGALNLLRIGGPILVAILTILDGIKSFTSFKDEQQKKFFDNLKTRLICIALLFIIPTIINFLFNTFFGTFC